MRSRRPFLLSAVLVCCFPSTSTGRPGRPAPAPGDTQCREGSWSETQLLRDDAGRNAYVEIPDVVPTAHGVAFIGSPALFYRIGSGDTLRDAFGGRLAGMVRSGGRTAPIPLPPGMRDIYAPRALAGDGGVAHVVWGTATGEPSVYEPGYVTALWYATFDGERWGTPERIADADSADYFLWSQAQASDLVRRRDSLFLAVIRAKAQEVTVFRRAAGRWTATAVQLEGAVYAALSADDSGRLFLGTVAPRAEPGGSDRNSVLMLRSSDGGATWSAPYLLHRSGRGAARELRLVATDDGRTVAVWAQSNPPDHFLADSLLIAASGDGGVAWRREPSLAWDGLWHVRAAARRGGRLLVLLGDTAGAGLARRGADGAWTPLRIGPRFMGTPSLSSVGDTLFFVRSALERPAIPIPALVTLVSELGPDCEPEARDDARSPRVPDSRAARPARHRVAY